MVATWSAAAAKIVSNHLNMVLTNQGGKYMYHKQDS